MSNYTSNTTLDQAAQLLSGARRIVVTTHAKPDGDACGAAAALTGVLRASGKTVLGVLMPPVPANLQFLLDAEPALHVCPAHGDDPVVAAAVAQADLVVVLDTGAWSQLSPLRELLSLALARTLILDHHLSGDVAARYCYVDAAAAAACEIVAQVIDRFAGDAALSPSVCAALFVGLAADTGWFRFSNTRAPTHELAARLLRKGVDQAEIYRKLEQNERPAKLALLARAVQSLTLLADNRAAIMVLHAADFAQTGALIEETEQLVDLPRAVGSVQVVALITEPPQRSETAVDAPTGKPRPGKRSGSSGGGGSGGSGKDADAGAIRISFRSKSGAHAIDVSLLAQRFGGGGHARAAGAKVAAPLEEVVERVTTALAELFPGR